MICGLLESPWDHLDLGVLSPHLGRLNQAVLAFPYCHLFQGHPVDLVDQYHPFLHLFQGRQLNPCHQVDQWDL